MNIAETTSIEVAEAQIDRFIERRAREKQDANRIVHLWVSSVCEYNAKRRRERREGRSTIEALFSLWSG